MIRDQNVDYSAPDRTQDGLVFGLAACDPDDSFNASNRIQAQADHPLI